MKIFVSHSFDDREYCRTFVSLLRNKKWEVWFDNYDMGSMHLINEIQKHLCECEIFIVILSKPAFRSTRVIDECQWAYNLFSREPQRRIIPITARGIQIHDFNKMLFLEPFKRIENLNFRPLPLLEAVKRLEYTLSPEGFEEELEASPSMIPPHVADGDLKRGKELEASGDIWGAQSFYEKATMLAPQNTEAWLCLASIDLRLDDYYDALRTADNALRIDKNEIQAWIIKSRALGLLQRLDEGLFACDEALQLDPINIEALASKGVILQDLHEYQSSLAVFEHILSIEPENVQAWEGKQWDLEVLGYDEAAMKAQEKIDELHSHGHYY